MEDLVQWAQGGPPTGVVGESPSTGDLTASAAPPVLGVPDPRLKKPRHRPNNGRKRRYIGPLLETPPWVLLRETGYPIPADIYPLTYIPPQWRSGPQANRWRLEVRAMWGTNCHLCGHADADSVDHLVPLSLWGNQPYDARLSRMAHGIAGCPTCHVKCNSSRGNRQLANQILNYEAAIKL